MSSNPVYSTVFYRCNELGGEQGGGGGGGWQRYLRAASLTIASEGSLTVRDTESGSLLSDFPKAALESFVFIQDRHIVKVNPVVTPRNTDDKMQTKIAMVFSSDVIRSVVHELKSKCTAPCHICNKGGTPLIKRDGGDSSGKISSSSSSERFELPDLKDPAVLHMLLSLLFDDKFSAFVDQLGSTIDTFRDQMDDDDYCGGANGN